MTTSLTNRSTTRWAGRWASRMLGGLLWAAVGAAQAQATEGEVRKIDRAQGKLTLKHGEIRNLDMPAMTMVFRVASPKLLEGLNEGDKVRFDVEKLNGQYTVVRLAPLN